MKNTGFIKTAKHKSHADYNKTFAFATLRKNPPDAERSVLAVLTYTISSMGEDELLSIIQDKYKAKLPEEEFNMLGALFDSVSEQLYGILSLSCKFLVATHDIEL